MFLSNAECSTLVLAERRAQLARTRSRQNLYGGDSNAREIDLTDSPADSKTSEPKPQESGQHSTTVQAEGSEETEAEQLLARLREL